MKTSVLTKENLYWLFLKVKIIRGLCAENLTFFFKLKFNINTEGIWGKYILSNDNFYYMTFKTIVTWVHIGPSKKSHTLLQGTKLSC